VHIFSWDEDEKETAISTMRNIFHDHIDRFSSLFDFGFVGNIFIFVLTILIGNIRNKTADTIVVVECISSRFGYERRQEQKSKSNAKKRKERKTRTKANSSQSIQALKSKDKQRNEKRVTALTAGQSFSMRVTIIIIIIIGKYVHCTCFICSRLETIVMLIGDVFSKEDGKGDEQYAHPCIFLSLSLLFTFPWFLC
jgi:hypothetical protein